MANYYPAPALSATSITTTGAISAGTTLASTGNFSVNTSKFTVAAASGNTVAAGTITGVGMINSAQVVESAVIAPTAITGATDNYNPTGLATAREIQQDLSGSATLSSVVAQAAGTRLRIRNITTNSARILTILHDDGATGTAANRFKCPNGVSIKITIGGFADFHYDATASRWMVDAVHTAEHAQAQTWDAAGTFSSTLNVTGAITGSAAILGTGTTAAAVGLSPNNDPNTGFYEPGADFLVAAAGGVGLMQWTSGESKAINGAFTLGDKLQFQNALTPAQITGSQNDYAPTGITTCNILRQDLSADWTITGLGGSTSGRQIILMNISAHNLTLAHASGSSAAANQFRCPNATNYVMPQKSAVTLVYDATSTAWQVMGPVA